MAQNEHRSMEKAVWKVSSEKQSKNTAMNSCMSMASTEDWTLLTISAVHH